MNRIKKENAGTKPTNSTRNLILCDNSGNVKDEKIQNTQKEKTAGSEKGCSLQKLQIQLFRIAMF